MKKLFRLVADRIKDIKKWRMPNFKKLFSCSPSDKARKMQASPSTVSSRLQEKFWRVNVPKKILNCIWNAVHNTIPTAHNLVQRKITLEPHCLRCNQETVEDTEHLFLNCPISRQIWRASSLGFNFEESANLAFKDWFWGWMSAAPNEEAIQLSFYILWHIWKSRNDIVFRTQPAHIHNLLEQANEDFQFHSGRFHDIDDVPFDQQQPQQDPLQQQAIIQIDGVFWFKSRHASAAWSIRHGRDDNIIIANGVSHFPASTTLHAKITACFLGVKEAHQRHLSNILIKTDSRTLHRLLLNSNNTPEWELYTLIHDLKFLCSAFSFVTCMKVSGTEVQPEHSVANSTRCNVCS